MRFFEPHSAQSGRSPLRAADAASGLYGMSHSEHLTPVTTASTRERVCGAVVPESGTSYWGFSTALSASRNERIRRSRSCSSAMSFMASSRDRAFVPGWSIAIDRRIRSSS